MFSLSLVPCGDGGGGIVEIAHHFFDIEHEHVTSHEDHSNTCNDDFCSPFCICNCCSSALETPSKLVFQIKTPPFSLESGIGSIQNAFSSSFNHSIWQPPKFS